MLKMRKTGWLYSKSGFYKTKVPWHWWTTLIRRKRVFWTFRSKITKSVVIQFGRYPDFLPAFNRRCRPGLRQVWSLTQFYSVDFSKSKIKVNKFVFNKRTIKVCVSCCWQCPGTSAPNAPHLMVSLFLCSSRSKERGQSRALEARRVSSKSPTKVRDRDKGVAVRNRRE